MAEFYTAEEMHTKSVLAQEQLDLDRKAVIMKDMLTAATKHGATQCSFKPGVLQPDTISWLRGLGFTVTDNVVKW